MIRLRLIATPFGRHSQGPGRIAVLAAVALFICLFSNSDRGESLPKRTLLGIGYSPARMPFPSDVDIERFFDEASQIGSGVVLTIDWHSMRSVGRIRKIAGLARSHGLKLHLYLDPIALEGRRTTLSLPESAGGISLRDPAVRRKFADDAVELAALGPDYLGLATEANLFAENSAEYPPLLTLIGETYRRVKKRYPSMPVTVSFQWDVMSSRGDFELLRQFSGIIDVYSFTSYPDEFGNATPDVPSDYFSGIRKALPDSRIGISELGWSSAPPGSERRQADFMQRVPALFKGLGAEYVMLAELHDVPIFSGDQARLNAIGLRTVDDLPKESWNIVVGLPALH